MDQLNRDLNIPLHLAALKAADIPALAKAACHEAHTGYPVPRYMTQAQCEALIRGLLPPTAEVQAKPAAKRAARTAAVKAVAKRTPRAAAAKRST